MGIKSSSGVYSILESHLRETKDPLTCKDLWEMDSRLKKYAADANRISDFLGHMWRRGLLQRWTSPKTSKSFARYAYTWKEQEDEGPMPIDLKAFATKTVKPNVTITEEDGRVVLDFEQFTIIVQRKA